MQRLDCDRHVGVLDPEKLYPKFLSYPVAGMSGCEKFDGISAG